MIKLEKILEVYEKVLKNMSKMFEVSINFLKVILRTITDLLLSILLIFPNVTNIKLILRISLAVYIYSKIAIILIPVIPSFIIPIPPQIKTFCEEYIVNINDLFSKINNTLLEYYTAYTDNKSLREQMQKNQNQIQSLVENEKNIYNNYQENINKIHNDYLTKYEELQKKNDIKYEELQKKNDIIISELRSNIELKDNVNKKLDIHNTELTEYVKLKKTTTQIEHYQSIFTLIGNCVLISVQCINTYNNIFNPPVNSNDIHLMINSVKNLINLVNRQNLNNLVPRETPRNEAFSLPEESTVGSRFTQGPVPFSSFTEIE